ncbi:MAG: TrbG/VirB9 family P-type conjugative transfer protein [Bryobacterales bacterium]|nr:TrbG/VirB9 family P-type conjugative transfer protein [Bryobacterales bacterium]MDE0434196.1 TrbG/VirB9 family P-type conjugative transfer protein [Bryobacterales bacterium]
MTLRSNRFAVVSLSLLLLAASSEAAKRVSLDSLDTDIVIQTRIRHATVIVLPDSEQILDFVAGDSETWAVSGAVNVAYVKPGEQGARTNIALICASGNIYSFRVHENSNAEPDLVVYVDYAGAAPLAADSETRPRRPEPHEPKFISRMDVAIYQEAAEQAEKNARAAWDQAERRMTEAIDRFRSSYPTLIRFEYSLEKKAERSPFEIAGMWHDGRFTYVRSHATEAPALYESRDGKPSLVAYDLTPDGLYIVKRVLHDGFFQIGKERAKWRRVPPDPQPDPQLRQGRITLTAGTEDAANAVPEPASEVAPQ